jgi:hypothetical protein
VQNVPSLLQSSGRRLAASRKDRAVFAGRTSIFSEEAGKPETGYGARFTTPDRRADLTVQSIINTYRQRSI